MRARATALRQDRRSLRFRSKRPNIRDVGPFIKTNTELRKHLPQLIECDRRRCYGARLRSHRGGELRKSRAGPVDKHKILRDDISGARGLRALVLVTNEAIRNPDLDLSAKLRAR